MPLDLLDGDEALADASPAERRRAARKAARENSESSGKPASSTRSSGKTQSAAAQSRLETELLSRLNRTFDRIATMLDARDDAELAGTIRQDQEMMSQGLVSLTRNVKFLRSPLLMTLNLVEPVMAFGRVARILYGRFVERQQRIASERQMERERSPVHATQ